MKKTRLFRLKDWTIQDLVFLGFALTVVDFSGAKIADGFAQTPPDAGTLRNKIENELKKTKPKTRAPMRLPEEMKPLKGVVFKIDEFKFQGNALLKDELLASAVKEYENRAIDFNGLQAAAAAVGKLYREKGWLVRVYLPEQEIQDGSVVLQIVEAILGDVKLEGDESQRLNREKGQKYIEQAQKKGAPLSSSHVDRGLFLLDDLAGVSVSGRMVQGQNTGETDILLKFTDEPLLSGDAGIDNTGVRSTGRERLTANLNMNSLLKRGEKFTLSAIANKGSKYGRLALNMPVGYDGLALKADASVMSYKLTSPDFEDLGAKGDSTSFGLGFNYPLIRSQQENLNITGEVRHNNYLNKSSGEISSKYNNSKLVLGLNATSFDDHFGGGANAISADITYGRIALGDIDTSEDSDLKGGYSKITANLSRQQAISEDVSAYVKASAQWAKDNLDSSEEFYLGGLYGVRAYPGDEGGGSDALLLSAELRYRVHETVSVSAFYDWGRVRVNKNNDIASPADVNMYDLHAIGSSLSWDGPKGFGVDATYSTRLGNNPNRTTGGQDQDGTRIEHRLWLVANVSF
ncbi:Polypeptide-transport-associated domain-containing protein [Candidatus Terasakiella magnetica]|uniref:Polypeptide-transport-associated domain-containing protein n=1 Tax=Candidatus Terasakiella magnetica TaxID=1867952 RepID=A0A1C3RFG5_9PROT|nr:ShlB/FhaC/HecB family hemolysin secretion/activation protein [Candidatus Terasakiella magnetica]SCA55991.1 Polypeptide-transport-associated domain-containing protein [Candidatus Terasakiella magnetica]